MQFPYRIDRRGRTAISDGEAAVRELVEQVLWTTPGERVMRPSLGTGTKQLVFAPLDDQLAAATRHLVQSTLQTWLSDLVLVEEISTEANETTLIVSINYTLLAEGRRATARFSRALP